MFLILKSGKRKPICRECRKVHAAKDCPVRARAQKFFQRALEYQRLLVERATG